MKSTTRTRAAVACTAAALVARSIAFPHFAHADASAPSPAAPSSSSSSPSPAPAQAPAPIPARGVAVLAAPGANDAAWALAKEIYARPTLRPSSLDEPRARVLAGETPPADASRALHDLADERAAIHGDDGASRALLRTIASQLDVRAIALVLATNPPTVRIYLADADTFDAARYEPDASSHPIVDAGTPELPDASSDGGMDASPPAPPPPSPPAPVPLRWSGAVASIDRVLGSPPPAAPPPSASSLAWSALPAKAPAKDESHPFYASPWFWAAVGAAAFGGTAVYFATRDSSASAVHLELQVH